MSLAWVLTVTCHGEGMRKKNQPNLFLFESRVAVQCRTWGKAACTSSHLEMLWMASERAGERPWSLFSTNTRSKDCGCRKRKKMCKIRNWRFCLTRNWRSKYYTKMQITASSFFEVHSHCISCWWSMGHDHFFLTIFRFFI